MRRATTGLLAAAATIVLLIESPRVHAWATSWHIWAVSEVPYYVNPANTEGLLDAAVANAFQTAASAWTTPSFRFAYAGPTSANTVQMNYRNEVFFRSEPQGAVAASTYTYWDGMGRLLDTDMVVWQSDYQFFVGTFGCDERVYGLYLEDIATHEFGHALGLDHSSVPTATMYPYFTSYCAIDWRYLDPDDLTGLNTLYPPTSRPPAPPSHLVIR